jgi:hypothetical protein
MTSQPISRRQMLYSTGIGLLTIKSLRAENELSESQSSDLEEGLSQDWKTLAGSGVVFEHWTPEENSHWQWYRLERHVAGDWKTIGISLPKHKESGEAFEPSDGYLSPERIPEYVITGEIPDSTHPAAHSLAASQYDDATAFLHAPDPEIRSRDGRPPSEWLRSLYAEELRIWLPSIETSETGVNGMTFWVHLIRDHGFDPRRIEGLTENEFRKLHSASHDGY